VGISCVWLASAAGSGRAAWGPIGGRVVVALSLAVVACNLFVMRYPLLDGEVDRYTAGQRLLAYAPFLLCTAAFLWSSRGGAVDREAA
jgi:hypothetical protein